MINFLHTFVPQPIFFELGFLKIHWYGIFIVLAILAGMFVALRLAKAMGIKSDEVYNLGFYLIIFGLLGARVYAVMLDLPFYSQNPFKVIAIWHGGLAIHGVIIGGLLCLIIYCKKKKQSFFQWADLLAVILPLAQAIGRWGNYFNQELFGSPTKLPWGIPIDFVKRPLEHLSQTHFQPMFLYESILNLLNFAILLLLFYFLKLKQKIKPGIIFLIYLINYSIIRIVMEFFRLDATPIILGIRLPILVSAGVIAISVSLIVFLKYRRK